jgi:hypothetical protein
VTDEYLPTEGSFIIRPTDDEGIWQFIFQDKQSNEEVRIILSFSVTKFMHSHEVRVFVDSVYAKPGEIESISGIPNKLLLKNVSNTNNSSTTRLPPPHSPELMIGRFQTHPL